MSGKRDTTNMTVLKEAITESGLFYKEVAELTGYTTGIVCGDVAKTRLTAEKAIRYGKALGIDPAYFRPDIFSPGQGYV